LRRKTACFSLSYRKKTSFSGKEKKKKGDGVTWEKKGGRKGVELRPFRDKKKEEAKSESASAKKKEEGRQRAHVLVAAEKTILLGGGGRGKEGGKVKEGETKVWTAFQPLKGKNSEQYRRKKKGSQLEQRKGGKENFCPEKKRKRKTREGKLLDPRRVSSKKKRRRTGQEKTSTNGERGDFSRRWGDA